MSTPTAVADAELARILTDNEDYILSVTKSQAVDLSKEMFQRCVISDSMMDQFSSLDHSRVDPKLQLRYLLRLVTQRIQEDGRVGAKFLSLLESMKEYPLCEYLRRSCSGNGTVAMGTNLDSTLTSDNISWLLEELAEVSPKWEMFGIALGLPTYIINNVRGDDNIKNLWHILDVWLSGASTSQPTTTRTLTQALRSKIVSHGKLAKEIEVKFRSLEEVKVFTSSNNDSSQLALTIMNQSCREVQVEDGKSTLLMVQASHRENVSYQWNKNGQPLADDYMYSGVHDSILVISHAHQGTGGEYMCSVSKEMKDVSSNKVTMTVFYPPEKKELLDLYSVNTHPLDYAWPPVGTETFINLVLVKSGAHIVDISSDSADRVTGKTWKIEYKELFGVYKQGILILVEGRPGSGKTTLVHKVIKDWTQGNALVRANLVFLISLRLLSNTSQEDTLYSILKQLYTNTGADLQGLISDLERSNGEGACFVFDGLDEYHPHVGDKSIIFRLLHKSYLPLAMIIVSSRPGAMARLRQAVLTQHIEVRGFNEDQISEYIDNFPFNISSDSSLDPALLKDYLSLHPNVFHMCYLPIHVAIICFVYRTSRGDLPDTQTKIYEEFTRSMILRHLKRSNPKRQLYSLKELPEDTREYFSKLCLLAFNMTVEQKQVINERDISFPLCEDTSPRADWSLGLVTCNRTAQLCGVSTSYMFLHLTLQEYLAAYHIVNIEGEEKNRSIEQVKSKPVHEFESMWTFFFGLEAFESQSELLIFRKILLHHWILSFRYAFESQQDIVCREIVRLNDGTLQIGLPIIPFDLSAIVFVVSSANQVIRELIMTHLGDFLFSDLRPLKVRMGLDETDDLISAFHHVTNLGSLILGGNNVCSYSAIGLLVALHRLINLKKLHVGYRILNSDTVIILASAFCHLTSLEILILDYNNMGSDDAIGFFSALCHLTKLKKLILEGNKIGSGGAKALSSAICHLTKLEILELGRCNTGSDGAISLTSALRHCTNLVIIDLIDNNIGSDAAITLASALHHHTELKCLRLSENGIDPQSAIKVITALKDCKRLTRLTLNKESGWDDFSDASVQLYGIVADDDSDTIDRLVAAVRLFKQELNIEIGVDDHFKTIDLKNY